MYACIYAHIYIYVYVYRRQKLTNIFAYTYIYIYICCPISIARVNPSHAGTPLVGTIRQNNEGVVSAIVLYSELLTMTGVVVNTYKNFSHFVQVYIVEHKFCEDRETPISKPINSS